MDINIETIFSLVAAVLGLFGGAAGIVAILKDKVLKKLVKEVSDVIKKVEEVRDEKSAGGKDITSKEAQELVKEVYEAIDPLKALIVKYAPKLAKKLGLSK